jgi:SAM-dependent methyltransferase
MVDPMRRSIDELRTFYGEPTGALVRRLLARRLDDAWGEAPDCDVLGVGYATPWLDAFVGARRVVAAMPGGQGVEHWPSVGRNRTLLVDDRRLPFAAGSFDRILLVHALEEADDPAALLLEAVRALAPTGRIILAAAARGGLWARAENTPFGHGRPFTRGQLEAAGARGGAGAGGLVPDPVCPALDAAAAPGRRFRTGRAAHRAEHRGRDPAGGVATGLCAHPSQRPGPARSGPAGADAPARRLDLLPTPRPHP